MKTLFSRILIAQVIAVVVALLVMTMITRASLNKGFKAFLERQEATVLQNVAPVLVQFYETRGSWSYLEKNPANWQRVWRMTRGAGSGPPGNAGPRQGRGRPDDRPIQDAGLEPQLRWMRSPDRGSVLRDRLFLLAADRQRIAGAQVESLEGITLEALEVDGDTVGWIGFAPMGSVLPPDARRFLQNELKIMALSLGIALVVAAALAWVLARTVSRPVRQLGTTVRRLSDGDFAARNSSSTRDEIGTLALHVNQLAETLEKNRTARQRWIADIAHELRTPVAVLKGEIEAVGDGVRRLDESMLASLTEEINHLAGLVNDLQALALADAGALDIQKQAVNLSCLVEQAADSYRHRLGEREIRFELDAEEDLEAIVDPQRIRQLLHNLLENSHRYVESGGRVQLRLEQDDGVRLFLEDSGPGVSDQQLEHLFDRFYRAEGSRARATGGSGLGLSICKNIVEAHGGSISASHSPMGGLALRVDLPA
jgi:two-component system sensor histidine kinase BaeS